VVCVVIDHEDVNFNPDSSVIEPSENKKSMRAG